jgi:succinate dehydrogenase cytochrome b subunit
MQKTRPFYLNLIQIKLPIGGFVSILHRASGALLSLVVPLLLYVFMVSLQSPDGFEQIRTLASGLLVKLVVFGLVWALLHHFFAGLRHLGFDLGWGEDKIRARQTAWATLVVAILLSLAVML